VQNVCLRAVGFWPGPENQAIDRKHFTITMSNCALLIVILVCQINFAFNSLDDKTAMVESVILSFTGILVIVKMVIYLWKYNEFIGLLETFDRLVTEGEGY
jgi:hypothetical protein